jgi:C4-dicarboxylate-specific signal transduction histidine kinase
MKIKIKVLLVVFTLLLISGAVTIMFNEIVSKDMIEHQVYNHLQTATKLRVNHIETLLKEHKELTKTASAGNAFRDIVDESKDHNQSMEQVKRRIKSMIEVHYEISRIRVLDKNGIVIASSHADAGFDKSAADIFLKGKEGVHAGDVHISTVTGNPVMSSADSSEWRILWRYCYNF